MSSNVIRTIETNEKQLNDLFKEVLDGLRDDIVEAQDNVKTYQDAILANPNVGIDAYGPSLNQALTVKGSARDRQLKFLNTFKDRVTKKEAVELTKEIKNATNNGSSVYDHSSMNKLIDEMKKDGTFANITIDDDDD